MIKDEDTKRQLILTGVLFAVIMAVVAIEFFFANGGQGIKNWQLIAVVGLLVLCSAVATAVRLIRKKMKP